MSTQRPAPPAPRIDRYGLHEMDCECARCLLGFRPTLAQRDNARRAYERAQAAKAEAERRAAEVSKPEARAAARAAAFREAERYTDTLIRNLARPAERPATPEELAALRSEFRIPRGQQRRKRT